MLASRLCPAQVWQTRHAYWTTYLQLLHTTSRCQLILKNTRSLHFQTLHSSQLIPAVSCQDTRSLLIVPHTKCVSPHWAQPWQFSAANIVAKGWLRCFLMFGRSWVEKSVSLDMVFWESFVLWHGYHRWCAFQILPQQHLNYLTLFFFSFPAPGAPDSLRAYPLNSSAIKVDWKAPADPNGPIKSYTVRDKCIMHPTSLVPSIFFCT